MFPEASNLIYRKPRDAGSEVFAFNPQHEMLGDERAKMLFENTAANSLEEIIVHLKKAGEARANGRAQQDDVTFVVVKFIITFRKVVLNT